MLLIVYGSMYPWRFAVPHPDVSAVSILLHSWTPLLTTWTIRDLIVNIALYLPLGFSGYLVFRRYWPPIALGAVLSVSIELAQVYVPLRNTSLNDWLNNVLGTVLGVAAGVLFQKLAAPRLRRGIHFRAADRGALLLVFLWVAYLIFPVFPINSFHAPLQKFRIFVASPVLDPVLLVSGVASWYLAGKFMASAGIHHSLRWLGLMLMAFPVQLSLVGRQPVRAAVLGAIAGIVIYLFLESLTRVYLVEACLFLAVIVLRGLYPFRFGAGHRFLWIPFAGLLADEWQAGAMVLIEKSFYYATAIWLFRAAGLRMRYAAALVTVAVAAIEVLQMYEPGRVSEITDPLIAIGTAFALTAVGREAVRRTAAGTIGETLQSIRTPDSRGVARQ